MGKDAVWKKYFSDNKRYADFINGAGCGGEPLVCAEELQELDTQAQDSGKRRDLLRKAAFGVNFAIIGIENQEEIDYSIPLRTLGYDVSAYEHQAAEIKREVRCRRGRKQRTSGEYLYGFWKESRLHPVVTFVLYYGEKEWDGPKRLHDILDFAGIPSPLRELVSDYRVNLIEVRKWKDTSVFQTDVRQVFDFIRYASEPEKLQRLLEEDPSYEEIEEDAFDVMVQYTKAEELKRVKDCFWKEGKINMCEALTMLIEEGREAGIAEGRMAGLEEGRTAGEQRFAALARNLIEKGRIEDLSKAAANQEYRRILYREFRI